LVLWFDIADGYEVQYANGTRQDPIDSTAGAAALRARYASRLAWIRAHHAKVVFVSPGPVRDGHDEDDLRRNSYRSALFLDQTLREVMVEKRKSVVGVIEMSPITCADWVQTHHCADAVLGGQFRESDGMHYDKGAVVAGAWLVRQVAKLDLGAPPS